jgi:hypothetical protein
VKSSELSQTTSINTEKPVTSELPTGATGPITKLISERRSHRRQWQIFERMAMIILDAVLISASFQFAHFLRYHVFLNSSLIVTLRGNLSSLENPHAVGPVKDTPPGNFF